MSSRRRQPRYPLSALLLAFCILGITAFPASGSAAERPGTGSGSSTGPSGGSQENGSSSASDKVDALTATREEVAQKVASLGEQYSAQQEAVAAADAAAAVAEEAVGRARARVALAQNEVELAQKAVQNYAIEAYVHPPAHDSLRIFSVSRAEDATYVSDVLKIMTDERYKVVDVLLVKKRIAAMESDLADTAADDAAEQATAANAQLASLDEIRKEQTDLAASIDERLERALSEAAALEAIDKQVARELAEQELELRNQASLVAASSTGSPTVELVADTSPARPERAGSSTTSPPPPTTSKSPNPTNPPRVTTTTRPRPPVTSRPSSPPSGLVTWSDVTNMGGGIWILKSLVGQVRALLDAATAAGFSLTGGGYRDSASQIATRRSNCGPTYYDIYEKPSGQCSPPTAIPGRSMHEQGRAMDLKSNGLLITSRSNPAFVWLSNNARRYGFYNLPSEPWHWSTNGH